MRTLTLAGVVLALFACGPDALTTIDDEGGDELSVVEGELTSDEVAAVLRYVNGVEGAAHRLWTESQITAQAANSIEAHVRGDDRIPGNADDNPCDTLAELDALPSVGAATLQRLANHAVPHYGPGSTMVKEVSFSADEQRDALAAVNSADLSTNTLIAASTWSSIVSKRPFSTFASIATRVPALTVTDLLGLRLYAKTHPSVTPGPVGGCDGAGGTYDTIAFTQSEECHAVEFLNKARFSELAALTTAARDLAYRGSPDGTWGYRSSRWSNLKSFSLRPNIGVTAMRAIKSSAAGWVATGLPYDTVASVYANRVALNGKPFFFEKVYVTKVFARVQDGDWPWECAELRDSPTSANYFRACFQYIGADSSSGCAYSGGCWAGLTGKYVSVGGYVRPTSIAGTGGWKLALNTSGTGAPNPAVP